MNRKINTLIFLIAATAFNTVAGTAAFSGIYLLYGRFVAKHLEVSARDWALPVILFLSFGLSFLAYHLAVRFFMKKADPEKFFSPFFSPPAGGPPEHRERGD